MVTADHIDICTNSRMTFIVGDTMELPTGDMLLETDDRIAMGTPAGLGQARNSPIFSQAHDIGDHNVRGHRRSGQAEQGRGVSDPASETWADHRVRRPAYDAKPEDVLPLREATSSPADRNSLWTVGRLIMPRDAQTDGGR